jgi:transposase
LKSAKGFGKAIVATARKLLAIVFSTLVNNWFFEDFVANKKKIVAINWDVAF